MKIQKDMSDPDFFGDDEEITEIYIPNHPHPEGHRPNHDFYITFKYLGNEIREDGANENLRALGLWKPEGDYLFITVTSDRKVKQAIEIFLNIEKYQIKENENTFSILREYKNQCEVHQKTKEKKSLPRKSKCFDKFKRSENQNIEKSINKVYNVIKNNSQKKYAYKEYLNGRSISEIEAFNGFCYRVLLGKRHPKVKGIYDSQGKRKGLVSELIPGFESVHHYINKNDYLSKEKIIKSEMIKIWVAAYVEEEMDLHFRNYGFDHSGYCIKIDDDRSTWPLTSKYYSSLDPHVALSHIYNGIAPISTFIVTQDDLESFPFLNNAYPHKWFDRTSDEDGETIPLFDSDKKDEVVLAMYERKFNDDMWFIFLKRILIPKTVYESIGIATLSSDNKKKEFVDHKCKKTEELKIALLDNPSFQQYFIANHKEAFNKIIIEFAEYNEDYKKEEDNYLRIDQYTMGEIRQHFVLIIQEVTQKIAQFDEDAPFSRYSQLRSDQTNDLDTSIEESDEVKLLNAIFNSHEECIQTMLTAFPEMKNKKIFCQSYSYYQDNILFSRDIEETPLELIIMHSQLSSQFLLACFGDKWWEGTLLTNFMNKYQFASSYLACLLNKIPDEDQWLFMEKHIDLDCLDGNNLHLIIGQLRIEDRLKYIATIEDKIDLELIIKCFPYTARLEIARKYQNKISNYLGNYLSELDEEDRFTFAIEQQDKIKDGDDLESVVSNLAEADRFSFVKLHHKNISRYKESIKILNSLPQTDKAAFTTVYHVVDDEYDIEDTFKHWRATSRDALAFLIKHLDKIDKNHPNQWSESPISKKDLLTFDLLYQSNVSTLSKLITLLEKLTQYHLVAINRHLALIKNCVDVIQILEVIPSKDHSDFVLIVIDKIYPEKELDAILSKIPAESHSIILQEVNTMRKNCITSKTAKLGLFAHTTSSPEVKTSEVFPVVQNNLPDTLF